MKVRGMYIDSALAQNLDILKKNVKKDWDFWLVIDGREGTGKSTLAQTTAKYLDPDFDVSRVVFSPQQFSHAVDGAEKYQAVVWDEAVTGTQSTDMTKMARMLKAKSVQLRQKNLFVILVIHSYFDMNKYYAVFRTWFLLHVYYRPNDETDTLMRGFFEFYDYRKKKYMYLNDKDRRFYSYSQTPNFRGRFTKGYVVDKDKYLEKKAQIEEDKGMEDAIWAMECFRRGMSVPEIKKYVTVTKVTLYRWLKQLQVTDKLYYVKGEEDEE